MICYKFIDRLNMAAISHFDYSRYLPGGEKLPEVKDIEMCAKGYHAATFAGIEYWEDEKMYEVELSGEVKVDYDKCCASNMRFIRRVDTWDVRHIRLIILELANFMLLQCDEIPKGMVFVLSGVIKRLRESIKDRNYYPEKLFLECQHEFNDLYRVSDYNSALWLCCNMIMLSAMLHDMDEAMANLKKALSRMSRYIEHNKNLFEAAETFVTNAYRRILDLQEE